MTKKLFYPGKCKNIIVRLYFQFEGDEVLHEGTGNCVIKDQPLPAGQPRIVAIQHKHGKKYCRLLFIKKRQQLM